MQIKKRLHGGRCGGERLRERAGWGLHDDQPAVLGVPTLAENVTAEGNAGSRCGTGSGWKAGWELY